MATGKPVSSDAFSNTRWQDIRTTTKTLVTGYFPATLGSYPDIINVYMALMHLESSFNVNAIGPEVKEMTSSGARDYMWSPPIKKIMATGSTYQQSNAQVGKRALGLGQCMGWNLVRGASMSGKCEVERLRPDLASLVCVEPGDDLVVQILGAPNMSKAILAGLIILEGKWKACTQKSPGWVIGGLYFSSHIYASVAAYLGLSAAGDANGTTYTKYANEIIGGKHYLLANGTSAPQISDGSVQYASTAANGPKVAISSGTSGDVPGCIAKASA